jgi:hypothetical protein
MDSISDSNDFEFGASDGIEDLEMEFVDPGRPNRGAVPNPRALAPGALEAPALAAPPAPHFGLELNLPELPKRTKTILAIAVGGAAGGFLVGGPVGATAGAILGFLMA